MTKRRDSWWTRLPSSLRRKDRIERRQREKYLYRTSIERLENRQLLAADLDLLDEGLRGDAAADLFPVVQDLLSGTDADVADGALDANLPLIGSQLASHSSGQFANAIEEAWATGGDQNFDFASATVQEVRVEIASRFASLGASESNVQASGSIVSDLVQFTIPLTQTLTNQTFDLSLLESPAVEVLLGHVDSVTADVTWSFDLVVGVTGSEFFIDVSNSSSITNGSDEISVNIAGRITPDLVGYGKLGIFGALYHQDSTSPSTFDHTYEVDLTSTEDDASLGSTEWETLLGQETTITGSAVANLNADFSAVPDFGGLVSGVDAAVDMDFTTDVALRWDNINVTDPTNFSIDGELSYDNTQVDFVKFLTEFITPTSGLVSDIVQPFSTIVDIFKDPIPGINEMFVKLNLGQGPSLIDLIKLGATVSGNQTLLTRLLVLDSLFLEPLDTLLDLPTFEPGDFKSSVQADSMAKIGSSKFGFASSGGLSRGDATGRQFQRLDKNADNEVVKRSLDGFKNPKGKKFKAEKLFHGRAGFAFPFLDDPGLLFDMMLGDSTVEFASFSSTLGLDFKFEVPFSFPFPAIKKALDKVGVQAEFGLEVVFGIATNLKYGYDAGGIATLTNQLDFTNTNFLALSVADNVRVLANGHFLDDHNATGTTDGIPTAGLPALFSNEIEGVGVLGSDFKRSDRDNPELAFKLSVKPYAKAALDLDILAFSAAISGGIVGTLMFDLNDLPNGTVEFLLSDGSSVPRPAEPFAYDGKVRGLELQEIANYSSNLTPFELVTTAGGFLNVGGSLVVEGGVAIGVVAFRFLKASWSFKFFKVTLASGQFPNNDANLIDSIVVEPPVLGTVQNDGTLDIYAGETASQRQFTTDARDSSSDNSTFEDFTFVSLGPTDPDDASLGETIVVNFVGRNKANGNVQGQGQQRFENVKNIRADGDTSADKFFFDSTVGVPIDISGGSGNDEIIHNGTAAAVIRGDEDDDTLVGGSSADMIFGGGGNDIIGGADGDDTIDGDDGNDIIDGEAGNDTINGHEGDDVIDGGAGDDTINGGSDDDTIAWDVAAGDDIVNGGDGVDALVATGATTTITENTLSGPSSPTIVELADDIAVTKRNGSLEVAASGGSTLTANLVEDISLQLGGGGDTVFIDRFTGNVGSEAGIDHFLNIEMTGGHTTIDGVEFVPSSGPQTEQDDLIDIRGVSGGGTSGVVEIEIHGNVSRTPGNRLITRLINTDKSLDSLVVQTGGDQDTIIVEDGDVVPTDLVDLKINSGSGGDTIIVENGDVEIVAGGGAKDITVAPGNHNIQSAGVTNLTILDDGTGTGIPVIRSSGATVGEGTIVVTRDGVTDNIKIDSPNHNLTIDVSPSAVGGHVTVLSTFSDTTTLNGGGAADSLKVRTASTPVTINGGGGNDALQVETNDAPITINGGGDHDTITIGAGLLDGINSDITVVGDEGDDTIVYDASNDPTARPAINVGDTSVTDMGTPIDPTFDATVETVQLNLGVAANSVTDSSLNRGLVVDGGKDISGMDTVTVTMIGASAGVNDGRSLSTTNVETVNFTHDNQGSTSTNTWLLQDSQLLASPTADRSSIQHVVVDAVGVTQTTLNLGDNVGSDHLIVRSLTEPTTINLRGGDDTVTLGDSLTGDELTIDAVQALLSLNGGADSGDLIQFDDAGRSPSTINISGVAISSGVSSAISHSGFPTINFTGRNDANATYTLNIDSLAAIDSTVNVPGSGEDLVTVSGMNESLSVTGGATDVIEFDQSATSGFTATMQNEPTDGTGAVGNFVTGSTTDVTFSGFGLARVIGSSFKDTLTINTDVAIPVLVEGEGGSDTVHVTEIGGITEVIGGTGADQVIVNVSGSPGAAIHSNLFDDLRVWAEQLVIDNSASNTATKWKSEVGIVAFDDDGDQNDDFAPFVRSIGPDEVKIVAGATPTSDTLVIDELIGTVSATINEASYAATDGQLGILTPTIGAPDIVTDFDLRAVETDGTFFYAVDGDGNLRVFDRDTLALLSATDGLGVSATSRLTAGLLHTELSLNSTRSVLVTTTTGFVEFAVDDNGILSDSPTQVTTSEPVIDISIAEEGSNLATDLPLIWAAQGDDLVLYERERNPGTWSVSQTLTLPDAGDGRTIKAIELNETAQLPNTYVAVSVPGADNDLLYSVDPVDTATGFRSPHAIGEGPVSFAQVGEFIYVAAQDSDRIDAFKQTLNIVVGIDSRGTFQETDGGTIGLDAPTDITATAQYLFVASAEKDTLAVFARNGSEDSIEFLQLLVDTTVTSFDDVYGMDRVGPNLVVAGGEGIHAIPIAATPAALAHGVGFQNIDDITVNTGDGADQINQTAAPLTDAFTLNTGAGADNLALSHFGPLYTLNTGAGNDTVGVSGSLGGVLNVNPGSDSDTINISGISSGNSLVNVDVEGDGNDVTVSPVGGSAGVFLIDGTDSIGDDFRVSVGTPNASVTVNSGIGSDLLEVLSVAAGSTVIANLGQGRDHVFVNMPTVDPTATVNVDAGEASTVSPPSDTLDPGAIGSVALLDNTDGFAHSINDSTDPQGTATVADVGKLIYDNFEGIPGFVPTRATVRDLTISEGAFSIGFNSTISPGTIDSPAVTTIVSRDWDLDGDGLFDDATGEDPTFTFSNGETPWAQLVDVTADGAVPINDDGVYQIAFKAVDDRGDVAIAYGTLTVNDRSADATLPSEVFAVFAGSPVTLPITVTDPGNDPVSSMTVTFEDSTTQTLTRLTSPGNVANVPQTFEFVHTFEVAAPFIELTAEYVTDEATFTSFLGVSVFPPAPTLGQNTVTIGEGDDLTFTPSTVGADNVLIEFSGDDLRATGSADYTAAPNQPFTITWAELNSVGVNDDGTYTFQMFSDATSSFGGIGPRPFDSDPDSSVTTITLIVENVGPSGSLTGDSVTEGQDANVNFTNIFDPGPLDGAGTITLSLDIGNDGTVELTDALAGGGNLAFTVPASLLSNGALAVPVLGTLTDKDGGVTELFTQINVTDVVPTLTLSGADSTDEGSTYSLSLSATDLDLGGDVAQWLINWGDNTTSVLDAASGTVDHIYTDNDADGMATIVAALTDADGTYSAVKTITVNDVAPTLGSATDASAAQEGTLLVFDLTSFDPGDDALQSWSVNWGDGSPTQIFGGQATQVTHLYVDDDTFEITATATDEEGAHTATPLSVTIQNVSPEVEFSTKQGTSPIVQEGSELILTIGDVVDAGRDFPSQLIVHWGDGQSTTINPPVDAITTETENNDDGVTGAQQTDLDVANDLRGSFSEDLSFVGEGQRYSASISGSIGSGSDEDYFRVDVSAGDELNFQVSGTLTQPVVRLLTASESDTPTELASELVTGSLSSTNFTEDVAVYIVVESQGSSTGDYTLDIQHVRKTQLAFEGQRIAHLSEDGGNVHTIIVDVVDEDGTFTSSTTLDVAVTNVAPTVQVAGAATVNAGETYTLQLSEVVDPGDDTPTGFEIDWGDNTVEAVGAVSQATHEYAAAGTFTILVSVVDEDGTSTPGSGAYRLNLELTDVDAPELLTTEAEPNDDGVDGIAVSDLALAADLSPNFVPIGGRDFEATFSGVVDSLTDFGDFFSFHALNGESINILLTGDADSALADPKLALVDSTGAVLANNDDIDIDNLDAALSFDFTADGQYFIVADTELVPDPLDSQNMIRGTGSYTLRAILNRPTAADLLSSEVEANDDGVAGSSAADLPFANDLTGSFIPLTGKIRSASIAGTISAVLDRDLDFYRFTAAPGDEMTIEMNSDQTVDNALVDPVVRLFDRDGNELGFDDNSGTINNARLTFDGFTYEGDYYVVADSNASFGVQQVTVNEVVSPTIVLVGNSTVVENSLYTLTLGQISGPGANLVNEILVNWGDGTTDVFNSSGDVTHTYGDDFAYTISADLMTTDNTLFENAAQQRLVVEGAAPVVLLDPVPAIDESGTATLTGSFSDVGDQDTFTLEVNWGDPASPTNVQTFNFEADAASGQDFSLTHQYLDDNPLGFFTATVKVIDDDGATGTATETVTVNNLDPVISQFNVPSTARTNTATTFSAVATDPAGAFDPLVFTWTIELTTGTNAGQTTQLIGADVSFTPLEEGDYSVTLEITDGDGGIATAISTISVSDLPANNHAPIFTSPDSVEVPENTFSVVNLSATDADLPPQEIAFRIEGGEDAGLFQIVSGNQLEFATVPDFEDPADVGKDNVYEVRVVADDGQGLTTPQTVLVTVTDDDTDDHSLLENSNRVAGNLQTFVNGSNFLIFSDGFDNGFSILTDALGNVVVVGLGGSTINGQSKPFIAFPDTDGVVNRSILIFGSSGEDVVGLQDLEITGNLLIFLRSADDYVGLSNVEVGNTLRIHTSLGRGMVRIRDSRVAKRAQIVTFFESDEVTVINSEFEKSLFLHSLGGDDQIRLDTTTVGTAGTILTGGGQDKLDLTDVEFGAATRIKTGFGDDEVNLLRTTYDSSFVLVTGSGNDRISSDTLGVQGSLTVHSGTGDDVIDLTELTAASSVTIQPGSGNDAVRLRNSQLNGALTIAPHTGKNVVDLESNVFNDRVAVQTHRGSLALRIRDNEFNDQALLEGGVFGDDTLLDDGTNTFALPPSVQRFDDLTNLLIDEEFADLLARAFSQDRTDNAAPRSRRVIGPQRP